MMSAAIITAGLIAVWSTVIGCSAFLLITDRWPDPKYPPNPTVTKAGIACLVLIGVAGSVVSFHLPGEILK